MIDIKLTTCAPNWPWARQTPNAQMEWGPFRFHVDKFVERCDAWVVFESLSQPEETICPPENVIFIAGEPDSVGSYKPAFLNQFAHVVSGRNDLDHGGQVRIQQGHPWFVEKTFDELASMQPFPKQREMCVISSDKAFTDGHRGRLEFVDKLKARFGDRIDVWGRGIRDFDSKWDLLSSYRFAIVLENYQGPDWLTEKLPDALLAYCYPIYYGCSNLERYLPENAYLRIDIEDPDAALNAIERLLNTPDVYEDSLGYIARARLYYLYNLQFFANLAIRLQTLVVDRPPARLTLAPNSEFPITLDDVVGGVEPASSGRVLTKAFSKLFGRGTGNRQP
ncbi:glycosyltransferase family 10 [Devosia sp. Leaf64]|uniref:glycosyltransferase family 10 domain-containing protein n=1 Tax=Devosia sp. Leaf64 TaxID=1736229 RepID=UPI000712C483|nr:glycosyltransferase family 10 [Devosia sp. Leaf64]KQN74823.1 hypothetical protein ASE94_00335 [Devosia sp. Leaf64]